MDDFNAKYQEGKDGPLTKEVRDRISAFRPESTLADIGRVIGFSGAFVSQLLSSKNPGRVRTLHVPRIIEKLEAAEANVQGQRDGKPTEPSREPAKPPVGGDNLDVLKLHMRAIEQLGLRASVTLP
jgi:hypothetical protein